MTMKTRISPILLLLLFVPLTTLAQQKSLAQDTLAFRTYLSDNVGTSVDLSVLAVLYSKLADPALKAPRIAYAGGVTGVYRIHESSRMTVDDMITSTIPFGTTYGDAGNPDGPDFKFPRKIRIMLNHRLTKRAAVDIVKEKETLVKNLQAFDSLSYNKPVFFSTIYSKKFGGDIVRYVDYLYEKSFLISAKALRKFYKRPRAKRLQADPGVQFAIGLALYNAWIERVQKGEISEQEAFPEAPLAE